MALKLFLFLHVATPFLAATAELDHQASEQELVIVIPVFASLSNLAHKLLLRLLLVKGQNQLGFIRIVFFKRVNLLFLVWFRPVKVTNKRILHSKFLETAKQELHGVVNHSLETTDHAKHEIERVDCVSDRVGHSRLGILNKHIRGVAASLFNVLQF